MSENKWLIGVVVLLLIALVGLVCVAFGAIIICPQPGSFCNGLFGGTTVASNTPAPGATRAPSGQPTRAPSSSSNGQVLRIPGADPQTLDPANAGDADSASYIDEIFSGLVSFDRDLKIVPELAEKWDTSADGKAYTFHLRKDAKFHDGRPVTAQDFKYSFERAADPRTHSTVAPLYLSDIIGFNDKYSGAAQDVKGVKVIDNYTLELDIDAPKSYFLAELTHTSAFVVDSHNVQSGSQPWYLNPNGTGAFKLKEWQQGQQVILVKNPDYYGTPKPTLDEVDFVLAGGSRMTMYENGDLDASPVGIADIDRVNDTSNPLNKELTVAAQLETDYLVFNTRKPPFDDANVRKAFAMAIDRQKLIDVVGKKIPLPATGILPQAFPGFNENLKAIPFDPAAAKQLLQQSKYAGKLPDVTWNTVGAGGTAFPETQAIAAMLKDNLGVNVSIEQTDLATYYQQINNGENIQYQMFDIGWIADYVDPHDFLCVLFCYKLNGQINPQNWSGYNNPDVDQLLTQASVESDQSKRIQLYQQAEQKIMDDVAVLPLDNRRDYWVTKPYVKDLIYPALVIPRLKYASLQK